MKVFHGLQKVGGLTVLCIHLGMALLREANPVRVRRLPKRNARSWGGSSSSRKSSSALFEGKAGICLANRCQAR